MQETEETLLLFLDGDDPLEESIETHSGILASRIPWTGEPGGLQFLGLQRVRRMKQLSSHACDKYINK